jgi:hypothetical protein
VEGVVDEAFPMAATATAIAADPSPGERALFEETIRE